MDHRCRIIVHIHNVICVRDLHAFRLVMNAVSAHYLQYFLAIAYQCDLRVKVLCCLQSAQHRCFRRVVASHCVQNDLHINAS